MVQNTLFEFFGRLFFTRKRVRNLESEMAAAGLDIAPEAFAGYLALNIIFISVILTFVIMLYPPIADSIVSIISSTLNYSVPAAVVAIAMFFIMLGVVYASTITLLSTYLIMVTENRREVLEETLPDFLTLVASNIKAGMSLDQAMWYSSKPEFGLLTVEIKAIVKGSFSGESLEHSLDKLALRFDSRIFKRTIALLKQASATGGELNEVFVLFAAVVGTPFLFAVSQKLIEIFEKMPVVSGNSGAGAFGTFGFSFSGPLITSTEFFYFTIPIIFVTALFSSFIVSAIKTGTKNQGLKYFPFVFVGGLFVYWIVNSALSSFFSTLV